MRYKVSKGPNQSRRGKEGEPMDREMRGEKNKGNDDLGNKIQTVLCRQAANKRDQQTKSKLEIGVGSWSGCTRLKQ